MGKGKVQLKRNQTLEKLVGVNLTQATQKKRYNQDLFEEVAPVYDTVTPLLSLGQDRRWKTRLVGWVPSPDQFPGTGGAVCLDLACGTGDFCQLLEGRFALGSIYGLDQSAAMMSDVHNRFTVDSSVQFLKGDMTRIPLGNESVDIVTGGYALRNAPDLSAALKETARVLRPGGLVAILDFSKSHSKFIQWIQLRILALWGKLWGYVFHRNPEVYGYLARSLAHFPDHQQFETMLREVKLETLRQQTGMMGLIRLLLLQKK